MAYDFGFVGYDQVESLGTNAKMTEASAAMALTSLESMEGFIAANRSNHAAYRGGPKGVCGMHVVTYDERERANYQYVVVEVDASSAGLTADQLVEILAPERVLARRYFRPGCHRVEPHRSGPPAGGYRLPHTERLADRTLALPTGTAMSPAMIEGVCALVRCAVANAPEIRRRLEASECEAAR